MVEVRWGLIGTGEIARKAVASAGAEGDGSVLCRSHSIREPNDTLYIFGSEGAIHVAALSLSELVRARGGDTVTAHHPSHPICHSPLILDFREAFRGNRAPLSDGSVGLEVQLVKDAICAATPGTPQLT
jgi:predicted dehydrogenase